MMIRVLYKDNTSGMVKDYLLDDLINSGKIVAFFRSSGWVAVGRDPVRKATETFDGAERRKTGPKAKASGLVESHG
ncbi:GSU3473 family protein [Geobacter sp. DSM 9736]|uniref:GSU3473 family protein n=1 Tax=Geobacter sp. DSM 9736 TaxID=1277350 RepID=UPI000B5024F9|nr:hypothetical protein [Geobacter sp. DSM 9736]SNB44731.1 hypothetical protein SAMN06269301_0118 [Geobacter sp. DSM 9736]